MKSFLADCSGATAIEYGLICVILVIALVASLNLIGAQGAGLLTLVNQGFGGGN